MRFLEISYERPEQNLALDEVLLNAVESGNAPDTLRIWESPVPFAVIGSGQEIRTATRLEACIRAGIPVLRRCTAGGAVVQGPGSLNFSLCVSLDRYPAARDIKSSYRCILGKLAKAFSDQGLEVTLEGTSDMAVAERKISGNAQRRKPHAFLHHGTMLYRDLSRWMSQCLAEPVDRPEYRGDRPHAIFVGHVPWPRERLQNMIWEAFAPYSSQEAATEEEQCATLRLANEKYACSAWTHRR